MNQRYLSVLMTDLFLLLNLTNFCMFVCEQQQHQEKNNACFDGSIELYALKRMNKV